jgi:hypothetical protein
MISGVYPEFPADAFVREALEGYSNSQFEK